MTAPTNHHLTVTDQHGKQIRARVVYLQPKAERWREQTAEVHILCSEWLEPHGHRATYRAGDEWFDGQFMPRRYESPQGPDWLFKGTFERTQA